MGEARGKESIVKRMIAEASEAAVKVEEGKKYL